MKKTIYFTSMMFFITISLFSQSLYNKEKISYYLGARNIPLKIADFKDFHISDWRRFGLGVDEGRVFVPLSSSGPEGSFGATLGLLYEFNEKSEFLLELNYKPGDFSVTQISLGINKYLLKKSKFRAGYFFKLGYSISTGSFGEIEVLPGKTPPVVLDEGTFNVGDNLKMELTAISLNPGLILNFNVTNKIVIFANAGYFYSFGREATLKANETEIPLSSEAIVQPDGTSTPANIKPTVRIQGLEYGFGIIYKLGS